MGEKERPVSDFISIGTPIKITYKENDQSKVFIQSGYFKFENDDHIGIEFFDNGVKKLILKKSIVALIPTENRFEARK